MNQFDQDQKEFWNENTNVRPYDHPVVKAFATQRLEFIRGLLAGEEIRSCLEVGCGDGFGTYYMSDLVQPIFGCDISLKMLRSNPVGAKYLAQADVYHLPYPDRSFDLVYCWEVLHHLHDPYAAIREMMRISRRFLLIFEPNSFNPAMALFGLLTPSDIGLLRFTPWYLSRLFKKAGIHDRISSTVGCVPPNRTPAWLARFLFRMPYKLPLIGITNVILGRIPE